MIKKIAFALACLASVLGMSTPGHAANVHSYFSATGAGNVCSLAAPCGTLGAAIDATASGGVVSCVDGGNSVNAIAPTISKSITIDCTGFPAAHWYLQINGAGIEVTVRGLTIASFSAASIGIDFQNGAALFVENCVIENFHESPGIGIRFSPPADVAAKLHIRDSVIKNNGLAASGGGVIVQPRGSGSARVVVERTTIENNTYGFFANGTGSSGNIITHIKDSIVSNSAFGGVSAYTSTGQSVVAVTMDRSSSLLNGADGILAQSPNAYVLLTNATVLSNATGLRSASGGNILSYQNNSVSGNVSDGAATGVLTVK